MLAEERFAMILDLLAQKRSATVLELCDALDASESTIRRDLTQLDRQGLLKKVHGGATLVGRTVLADEPPMAAREEQSVEEKRLIARAAAAMITEKDFIFLDAGSTTLALAAALEGPALQAAYVTNGIAHARMLVQKGCRTYLPGGQVRPITEAITGPETLAALQHYNFTKAFMGANGVSPAEGFTTPDPEEASIKTAALQRARERWFLVDNTKFDMVYSAVIGDIGCGAILTNHCPEPPVRTAYLCKGVFRMIYTVTFNPAIDYVLHLTAPLAVGEINRTSDEACQFGGKGINVSGVLRELGCESIALGFTAGETGAWLERGLQLSGLKTRFIRLPDGMTRINVKVKGAKETEINGSGPNITPEAMQALWDNLEELGEGDILVLAGSIPSSMPQDVYQQILARLDGRGIRFVVDATRDLLVKVLPYHPFLIKPNNHELGEIFGKELNRDEEITQAARKLQQRGARNVLVSMAGDGALLLDETGAVHRIGTPKGKVVNSVGAGDSMVAGFIAGYLQSGSYSYALRLGTACGSATAFSLGLAERRDIDALLKAIE